MTEPDAWYWKDKVGDSEGASLINGFKDAETVESTPLFSVDSIQKEIARLRDQAMDEKKSDSVIGAYNKLEEVFKEADNR